MSDTEKNLRKLLKKLQLKRLSEIRTAVNAKLSKKIELEKPSKKMGF